MISEILSNSPNLSSSSVKKMDMSEEQKIAMQKALANPLILEIIIKSLDFPQLLQARQVNSLWKYFSTEMLTNSSTLHLTSSKLKSVLKIFTSSSTLPPTQISIHNVTVETPDLLEFFELYGHQIKTLSLSNYGPIQQGNHIQRNMTQIISKNAFRRILLELTPNLDSLDLSGGDHYHWGQGETVDLPNLNHFIWQPYGDGWTTVWKVIEGASNVKTLTKPQLTEMEFGQLETIGKINCLKDFDLADILYFHQDNLMNLSRLMPKFQLIKLNSWPVDGNGDIFVQVKLALENILESSKKSLKKLVVLDQVVGNLMNYPRMKNLKELTIEVKGSCDNFKPIRIDLTYSCPNVQVLDLSGCCHVSRAEDWVKLFPPEDAGFRGDLQNVQRLRIDSSTPEEWFLGIREMCPNFTTLEICSYDETFDLNIFPRVFKMWSHLTSLEVTMSGVTLEIFGLDNPLTGMVTNESHQIPSFDSSELKALNSFSIRDLKDLKLFKVKLTEELVCPFSFRCFVHGFRFIPDLKIVLEFDHQKFNAVTSADKFGQLLVSTRTIQDELASFTNIRHRKTKLKLTSRPC